MSKFEKTAERLEKLALKHGWVNKNDVGDAEISIERASTGSIYMTFYAPRAGKPDFHLRLADHARGAMSGGNFWAEKFADAKAALEAWANA